MANSYSWRFVNVFFLFSLSLAQDEVVINLLFPAQGSTTPDTRPTDNALISHTLDSSIPAPTNFAWSVQGNSQPLAYTLFVSEDSAFDSADIVVSDYTDTMFPLWNVKIATPYYWKITGKDSSNNEWNSPVFSFTTSDAWPRMIYIDGTTNVRDIGGRRTMDGFMIKQGVFYRSAELNESFPITEKGIGQLMALGIACEIDLRNSSENPQAVLPPSVRYIRPVTELGGGIIEYQPGLVATASLYRDVFKQMADKKNYPMICHCRLGADRAGTVTAVLEALLGCSEHQMGLNYQWTSLSVIGVRDTTYIEWKDIISYLKSFDKQNATVQAGAWNYLQTIGMTVDELMAIRTTFIDDDRQPYPELSIKPYARIPRTIQHRQSRQYFLHSSRGFIVMKKGVRRIKVFDLSGKKIWEFTRTHFDAETKVHAPLLANKTYIVYSVKEAALPQL